MYLNLTKITFSGRVTLTFIMKLDKSIIELNHPVTLIFIPRGSRLEHIGFRTEFTAIRVQQCYITTVNFRQKVGCKIFRLDFRLLELWTVNLLTQ